MKKLVRSFGSNLCLLQGSKKLREEDISLLLLRSVEKVEHYGLRVEYCDLGSNTGEFDGESIKISTACPKDMSLFVLSHLFGHTVQWCVSESARQIGLKKFSAPVDEVSLMLVKEYEKNASQLGASLLVSVWDYPVAIWNWIGNWFDADWKYLRDLYTGKEVVPPIPNSSAWKSKYYRPHSSNVIECVSIPHFVPCLFEVRNSF